MNTYAQRGQFTYYIYSPKFEAFGNLTKIPKIRGYSKVQKISHTKKERSMIVSFFEKVAYHLNCFSRESLTKYGL